VLDNNPEVLPRLQRKDWVNNLGDCTEFVIHRSQPLLATSEKEFLSVLLMCLSSPNPRKRMLNSSENLAADTAGYSAKRRSAIQLAI
jgi:hypothetical protein